MTVHLAGTKTAQPAVSALGLWITHASLSFPSLWIWSCNGTRGNRYRCARWWDQHHGTKIFASCICSWHRRSGCIWATQQSVPLFSGEVEHWCLPWNYVHCVAQAAGCQLDQFERSKLHRVPRLANLVAMFGQFITRRVFFSNVKAIVTAVSLTTFGNIERPKMWNRQLQMVRLAKVTCKRSGNRLQSFDPHSPLFWALQVLWWWHQRCRWGRRPAGSLAELSPGEVELWVLPWNSVHCVAEAARCQLDQFERSKLRTVPRLANLVAMFGQFARRRVFFSRMLIKTIVTAASLITFRQHWKAKHVK